MINLNIRYAGMNLRNPLIVSSSGLTNDPQKNKTWEKAGVGAIVLNSLFEEQIMMMSDNMLMGTDYPEASDYIKNYVASHEVENYLKLIRETKKVCTIPVIASINCYKADAWVDFAYQIEMAGADALELNIFAVETQLHNKSDISVNRHLDILKQVKKRVNIPVIVKIAKFFNNIPETVYQLYANGANAVVLFNRFYQPDINIHNLQMTSGMLFSADGSMGDTLRWTGIVSGAVPQIDLAASTGVHDWEDAVKCILAGASAVQLCSTIYQNGSEVIPEILNSMKEWMNSMNYENISALKGKLNYANIPNPTIYERVQFMKYFSNRD